MLPHQEVELVIIGGGGAGLPAAVAAAENGASNVLVLEKRSKPGGNASMAWGIFAAESHLQKQEMVEARREDLFKFIMDWSHWKIDPAILKAYIWKSGDTIRWLEEKGLKFNLLRYFPGQEPPVWHVPDGRGARLVETLTRNCEVLGIQLLLNAPCKKILLDEKGAVNAVLAEKDGQEFIIKTRSVIIATGGYAGNQKLLEKFCDDYDQNVRCFGLPHDGDGLAMATAIGADIATPGMLLLEWPHVYGDSASVLATVTREPYTVYVNKMGQRFIDEAKGFHAFECANAVLRQPEKTGYILTDSKTILIIQKRGATQGRGNNRAEYRRNMPGLKDQIQALATQNTQSLMISDSWDQIARWMGAEPPVLRQTIVEYNRGCEHGRDEAFFKDTRYLWPLSSPPYYAIKGELVFLNTMGGLKINERMEVLNNQCRAIPGLYAAGADTGGWEPDTYCDKFSGTAFGFAVNSGRIAAENVVKYISGQ